MVKTEPIASTPKTEMKTEIAHTIKTEPTEITTSSYTELVCILVVPIKLKIHNELQNFQKF